MQKESQSRLAAPRRMKYFNTPFILDNLYKLWYLITQSKNQNQKQKRYPLI